MYLVHACIMEVKAIKAVFSLASIVLKLAFDILQFLDGLLRHSEVSFHLPLRLFHVRSHLLLSFQVLFHLPNVVTSP